MPSWFIEAASTYADDIDNLIGTIGVTVGIWLVLAQLLFFGFIFKFRAREGRRAEYIGGDTHAQKKWIHYPHYLVILCDIFLAYGAITVWVEVKQTLPEPYAKVRVIGKQWAWTFVHPGPDRKLDTEDDIAINDELHVTVDDVYHFELSADDVIHSFSVPVFRLKQDAIPGRTITGWFQPTKTGTFDIQCAEMCGIGHGIMAGRIIIESRQAHAAWLRSQGAAGSKLAASDSKSSASLKPQPGTLSASLATTELEDHD